MGVLPPKLLFTLTGTGMESAEKGPGVTLDKFGLLGDKLTGKLGELGPGADGHAGNLRGFSGRCLRGWGR